MKLIDYAWSLDSFSRNPELFTKSNFNKYMRNLVSAMTNPQADLFSFFSLSKANRPVYNFYLIGEQIRVCYIKTHVFRDVGDIEHIYWRPDNLPSYEFICDFLKINED